MDITRGFLVGVVVHNACISDVSIDPRHAFRAKYRQQRLMYEVMKWSI
jgi:hypothetical protein